MTKIDFFGTRRQYLDHMAPIWKALPAEWRGDFFVTPAIRMHAGLLRLGDVVEVKNNAPVKLAENNDRLTLAMSYGDVRTVVRLRPNVALGEHGNGQSFSDVDPSYSGGVSEFREKCKLFIVPNEHAAKRNLLAYPNIVNAVVGCPKLDDWHLGMNDRTRGPTWPGDHPRAPVVALSFHWDRRSIPETRSALPHYIYGLTEIARKQREAQWSVIGHGHPLEWMKLARRWQELGFRPVRDFENVMREADVYVNDCSSTIYEFASTGRPVVVLNAPWYRRTVEHGLRFWDAADVGIQVSDPLDLVAAIESALRDPESTREAREAAVELVYAFTDGSASKRAAEALMETARGC
jgi:hypothetical protein